MSSHRSAGEAGAHASERLVSWRHKSTSWIWQRQGFWWFRKSIILKRKRLKSFKDVLSREPCLKVWKSGYTQLLWEILLWGGTENRKSNCRTITPKEALICTVNCSIASLKYTVWVTWVSRCSQCLPWCLPCHPSLTSCNSAWRLCLPPESSLLKHKAARSAGDFNVFLCSPPAAFSQQTDRSWCVNTPNPSLREANPEACAPHCLLQFPSRIVFQ